MTAMYGAVIATRKLLEQGGEVMGVYRQHFHCVELVSEKSEISSYPTRWGAASRCHDLNKWDPKERWTVKPFGIRYVPYYNEQGNRSINRKEAK